MYPRQPMRTVDNVMSVLFRKLPFFYGQTPSIAYEIYGTFTLKIFIFIVPYFRE